MITRRKGLMTLLAGAGAALQSGCDAVTQSEQVKKGLNLAEGVNRRVQRLLMSPRALAREYPPEMISANFRANGSTAPDDPDYNTHLASGFADWRLVVDGLVERPLSLSLADIRALPARAQITRHDCVEGWSAIAKWSGAILGALLNEAGAKPEARYVVFHCADELEATFDNTGRYYESIDLIDAYHPQTILAYEMNDAPLTVPYGAPVRLRVERQLGYKHAKYVMRIEIVDSFGGLWGGKGGFWEDRGYQWYAGI